MPDSGQRDKDRRLMEHPDQQGGIPPDLYGAEDGDVAWYPGGTRNQARAVAESWWGDYAAIRAYRCHVRRATDEEKVEHGWGQGYGICVLECPKDRPGAVAGWRIEAPS